EMHRDAYAAGQTCHAGPESESQPEPERRRFLGRSSGRRVSNPETKGHCHCFGRHRCRSTVRDSKKLSDSAKPPGEVYPTKAGRLTMGPMPTQAWGLRYCGETWAPSGQCDLKHCL